MKAQRALILIILISVYFLVVNTDTGFGHSNSAPILDCTSCHQGDFKSGLITITGLPKTYKPGANYKLTITIKSDLEALGEAKGGFALEVSGGNLIVTDKKLTQAIDSILTHTLEGSKSRTWSFTWQAPKSSEDITFTVMAIVSNGDYSPSGDVISAEAITIKSAKK